MSAGAELISDIGRSGIQIFKGDKIHSWSLIADGNEEATTVTVSGASLGNQCLVSLSVDVTDIVLDAQVTAANTVTVVAANNTGGNITIGASTIYVTVLTTAP